MIIVKKNVVLAPYTHFKIGGPAKFFCEVKTEEDLKEAVKYARDNKLKIFILGGGANILVSDKGFNGLVIRIINTACSMRDTYIECGSGALLSKIVSEALKNSLSGLEWAAGIPGSVGGAVRGNAGAFGGCMADVVDKVEAIEAETNQKFNSKVKILTSKDCKFGYRDSIFKHNNNLIIASVVLNLQKGDGNKIENEIKRIIEKRMKGLPKEPSAGSFFKNPVVKDSQVIADFEKETKAKCEDGKVPAGWLIREAGLSGKKIGGIKVSEKHANFVINTGQGKAQEVVILASLIKQKIRQKFNLELEEEVKYVGF